MTAMLSIRVGGRFAASLEHPIVLVRTLGAFPRGRVSEPGTRPVVCEFQGTAASVIDYDCGSGAYRQRGGGTIMIRRGSVIRMLVGVSWLVFATSVLAAQTQLDPTRATGEGPEYRQIAPETVDLWRPGDPGQRLHMLGRVTSTDGRPIAGAELIIWQADGAGSYHEDRYRALIRTAEDGGYRFSTVLPGQYYGLKHIHMVVDHRAHHRLPTRILFKGDPLLDQVADGDLAIDVEEARVEGETVLFGRFDIVMQPRTPE